jgi:hypothetical protein
LADQGDAPRRFRVPWWAWVLAAIVVTGGTIAALGGFNDVPVQALPKIELGETYTTNLADVTVESVEIVPGSPFNGFLEEGSEYLTVTVEVTNRTDEPSIFARDLIAVLVEGVISPTVNDADYVVELRNGSSYLSLEPDLPVRLAYAWEIPVGAIAPDDPVIVGIFEQHEVPDDPIFSDKTEVVAVVRIVTTAQVAS